MGLDLKAMGVRLADARDSAKLTQQAAATKAEIDTSSLSRYERGLVKDIALPTIKALADLYKVRLEWIVDGSGPMKGVQTVELDADAGYPGIDAYLEANPDLEAEYRDALRKLAASGGPDDITYEVCDGYVRGLRARDRGKGAARRPRLEED